MVLKSFYFYIGRNCLYTSEGSTRWPVQPFEVQVPFSFQGEVQQVSFPFPLRRKKKRLTGKQTEHLLLLLQLTFNLPWGNPSNNRYAPIFTVSRQLFSVVCNITYPPIVIYRLSKHTRLPASILIYQSILLIFLIVAWSPSLHGSLEALDLTESIFVAPPPSHMEDRTITHTHLWTDPHYLGPMNVGSAFTYCIGSHRRDTIRNNLAQESKVTRPDYYGSLPPLCLA